MLAFQSLLQLREIVVDRLLERALDDTGLTLLLRRDLGKVLLGVETARGRDGQVSLGQTSSGTPGPLGPLPKAASLAVRRG